MRAKVFRSLIRMLVHLVLLGQRQAAIARRLAASRWPATATRRPRPAPLPPPSPQHLGAPAPTTTPWRVRMMTTMSGACASIPSHPIPSHPDDARVFLLDCSASDDGSAHTNLKSIT